MSAEKDVEVMRLGVGQIFGEEQLVTAMRNQQRENFARKQFENEDVKDSNVMPLFSQVSPLTVVCLVPGEIFRVPVSDFFVCVRKQPIDVLISNKDLKVGKPKEKLKKDLELEAVVPESLIRFRKTTERHLMTRRVKQSGSWLEQRAKNYPDIKHELGFQLTSAQVRAEDDTFVESLQGSDVASKIKTYLHLKVQNSRQNVAEAVNSMVD